jgi:hypothetical protein
MSTHRLPLTCAVLLVGVLPYTTQAGFIVAPNANALTEGNFSNAFPFTSTNRRYQQVYDSSQFSALSGPEFLDQIAVRPDRNTGSFTLSFTNIDIRFSTTSKVPDGLSLTFADNIGADETLVYSGPLTLTTASTGPAGGPKDFDLIINLQTPFLYDPSLGNLLLDVTTSTTNGVSRQLDAVNDFGDHDDFVSRLSGPAGALIGNADNVALVTQFQFSETTAAVPEPSGLAIFSLVCAGSLTILLRRSRKRPMRSNSDRAAEPPLGSD